MCACVMCALQLTLLNGEEKSREFCGTWRLIDLTISNFESEKSE